MTSVRDLFAFAKCSPDDDPTIVRDPRLSQVVHQVVIILWTFIVFIPFFKKYLTSNVAKFIDTNDIENVNGYGYENKNTYFNSYFTIVTETYFFESYYYISEKTFKPIAHMHPFIILGRPGMIEYLKKFGFKTFHPFIDESYDLEENNNKRFEMVYNEIVKLNELSDEELDNFMDKIKDILYYNQQKLLQIGGQTKMILELNRYIRKNLNKKNLI